MCNSRLEFLLAREERYRKGRLRVSADKRPTIYSILLRRHGYRCHLPVRAALDPSKLLVVPPNKIPQGKIAIHRKLIVTNGRTRIQVKKSVVHPVGGRGSRDVIYSKAPVGANIGFPRILIGSVGVGPFHAVIEESDDTDVEGRLASRLLGTLLR